MVITKYLHVGIVLLLVSFFQSCKNGVTINSPNKKIEVTFKEVEGKPNYSVSYNGDIVIEESEMGFQFSNGKYLVEGLYIRDYSKSKTNEKWKPIYGERKLCENNYNETVIWLTNNKSSVDELKLTFRVYNEGVAFKYTFLDNVSGKITKEITQFSFSKPVMTWVSEKAQDIIEKIPLKELEYSSERPLLIEYDSSLYAALGEAALVDFAPMKLKQSKSRANTITSELNGNAIVTKGDESPWRYIMLADSPTELLEHNYLILNLNEPCKIEETSWIKPGKVIRETTLTTQGGIACVDFAEKYNLQYIEYDAGWYGFEYDKNSDATKVKVDPKRYKGPLDLHKVIGYAKSKDIGVILYVNKLALEEQLDEILPLYKSWGVAGVKFGFVRTESQEWISWLHEAVRKAASYELMVDIHDEYRPTGYSRTYPNLITQEGIRGDETKVPNEIVINTLFTRMIAGAGDHTNCYFSGRVEEYMGSHASQLAKTICIYSPWQFLFWYDRPIGSLNTSITEVPELHFFAELPTVWDDTKILDGYPGEYAIVARKKDEKWFVGVLNGVSQRDIKITLDFLDPQKEYIAQIYSDDRQLDTRTNVKIEKIDVDYKSEITKTISRRNGLALIISPK